MASKSSILSLVSVSGLWLITDSTSHRKVVNESSVNVQSHVITLNARFRLCFFIRLIVRRKIDKKVPTENG